MEYEQVGWLADQVAAAATGLSGGGTDLSAAPGLAISIPLPLVADPVIATAPAFGNTDAAHDCLSAYHHALGAADDAVTRLGAVLDTDVQRLGAAVTTFQQMDHAAADRVFSAAGQGVNVYSAHLHSDGSNDDDFVRAGQIDRLRQAIDGPALLGADLNAELDDGNLSSAAVARFGDDGFDVNAGEVGGTSHSGRSIDYVMPVDGITAGNPTLVDGGTSDHDGQRVDVAIPNW